MKTAFRVIKNGKQPLISDWRKGEPDEVVQEHVNNGGNWGLLTGVNGLIVLDLDNHKPNQTTGSENLEEYLKKHNLELPPTYQVTTPSGGIHLYFQMPDEYQDKSFHQNINAIPSLDFQYKGRYVVGANSVVDGTAYVVSNRSDMALLPEWLCKLYLKEDKKYNYKRKPNKSAQVLNFMVAGVTEGGRNNWIAQLTGKLLATGADDATVARMVVLANKEFVNPPLDQAELKQTFQSVLKADQRKRQ